MCSDRRHTLSSLASELDFSTSTVHGILKELLKESKLYARWVPRLLRITSGERGFAARKSSSAGMSAKAKNISTA